MIGKFIENYKIVSQIGEGGMGTVYKALDLKLERFVAIKILKMQSGQNKQFTDRFKREARNHAKLNHPNIIQVYGFVDERNTLGIVMEYVEGETVEDIIHRDKKLDPIEALSIFSQILTGTGYAHQKGFIHRDLKPSNIMINEEGVVKIMDFGISKSIHERGITNTGTKIGTLLYMSPEQINAEEPTRQSDIYSLGITLFEMLAGETPFEFETEFEIMEGHLKKNVPKVSIHNSELPGELDKIIQKSLDKYQFNRYASCEEFKTDIDTVLLRLEEKAAKIEKDEEESFSPGPHPGKKSNITEKISRYVLFAIGFSLIGLLLFFLIDALSDMWSERTIRNNNPMTDTTVTFQSHPDYTAKSSWERVTTGTREQLNDIFFVSGKDAFACGDNGIVIYSSNGGSSWSKVSFPDSSVKLNSIFFLNRNRGFIVGENGTIYNTANGGTEWRLQSSLGDITLFDISFTSENYGIIVGSKGTILRTTDSGIQWDRVSSNTDNLLYSAAFANDKLGFAVGWNGTILKTTDAGLTWNQAEPLTTNYLKDIDFNNDGTGIICSIGGVFFKTDNFGESWKTNDTGTMTNFQAVTFLNENLVLLAGNRGEILVSDNAGESWMNSPTGLPVPFTNAVLTPSKIIYVCGLGGTIIRLPLAI